MKNLKGEPIQIVGTTNIDGKDHLIVKLSSPKYVDDLLTGYVIVKLGNLEREVPTNPE